MEEYKSVFNSFDEVYEYLTRQTNHEIKHNITVVGKSILLNTPTMKLVQLEKTDKQHGLIVVFKPSVKYDKWLFWYIGQEQVELFPIIHKLYNIVDKRNSKFWGGK